MDGGGGGGVGAEEKRNARGGLTSGSVGASHSCIYKKKKRMKKKKGTPVGEDRKIFTRPLVAHGLQLKIYPAGGWTTERCSGKNVSSKIQLNLKTRTICITYKSVYIYIYVYAYKRQFERRLLMSQLLLHLIPA